jgi:3'-phosphoadenosine 5'-phosphosulfate sulfotransferase (PAPS reductase)/FAD synthetase
MAKTPVEKLIKNGALFVSNHSGGKDSMALLEVLVASVPKSQIIVVHASLGEMEWQGAQEKAQEHALRHGLPFFVAKANKSLFDMVNRRFATRPDAPSWPSAEHRQCTSDLKRDPIAKFVRHYADAHGYTQIVNCLGIRGEESTARGKRPEFSVNTRETNSKRSVWEWLPIHALLVDQVWALIEKSGVKRHFAYDLGNERLSCVFCIMGSTNDCQNGARHNPELLGKYIALERKTGYTMHQSRQSLIEIVFGTAQPDALAA